MCYRDQISFLSIFKNVEGTQPRPQGFSLKKWVGRPTHFFKGKALGTRLEGTCMIASLVLAKTFFKCATVIKFPS